MERWQDASSSRSLSPSFILLRREGLVASCQTGLAQEEVRGRRLAEISGGPSRHPPTPFLSSSEQVSTTSERSSVSTSRGSVCVVRRNGGRVVQAICYCARPPATVYPSSNPPGSPQHPSSRPPMSSVPDLRASQLFDVKGKVVLVTGGGGGIGLMQAAGFVSNGARGSPLVPPKPHTLARRADLLPLAVYIASRKKSQLEEATEQLNALGKSSGGSCSYLVADLKDVRPALSVLRATPVLTSLSDCRKLDASSWLVSFRRRSQSCTLWSTTLA